MNTGPKPQQQMLQMLAEQNESGFDTAQPVSDDGLDAFASDSESQPGTAPVDANNASGGTPQSTTALAHLRSRHRDRCWLSGRYTKQRALARRRKHAKASHPDDNQSTAGVIERTAETATENLHHPTRPEPGCQQRHEPGLIELTDASTTAPTRFSRTDPEISQEVRDVCNRILSFGTEQTSDAQVSQTSRKDSASSALAQLKHITQLRSQRVQEVKRLRQCKELQTSCFLQQVEQKLLELEDAYASAVHELVVTASRTENE